MQTRTILLSLLIGYVFGQFITGEIAARRFTGGPASKVGTTGNPGMANIMVHVGFKPGLLVLAGDLLKCVLAVLTARLIFDDPQRLDILCAGLGCTLGHDFPVWMKFKGGKGVASSCMAILLYSPLWGLISILAGLLVVLFTRYLCIGAIAIPLVFTVLMAVAKDVPAVIAGAVYLVLSVFCNRRSLRGIRDGSTEKNDVLGALKRKFSKKK